MINEEIKDKEVRLIDSDGSQLDVVNIEFVEISAQVCQTPMLVFQTITDLFSNVHL